MDAKKKEESLKLAEYYFRDNNYSFAQHILDDVIKIDPNNSKANELLAYIYGNQGKLLSSFELIKVACNQTDCSPDALYYLGSIQLERRLFGQAIESFNKSMSKNGEFFEALHDLATTYAQIGDITAALNCYQKCLKFDRKSFELFFNIARIFDDLKRYDEAIAQYDQALALKPSYAEGWSNKGATLKDLKRYDEAIAHYDKALSLKPDYPEAWSNKGATLNELKRYDEAIAHYDKALSLKPDIDWVSGDLVYTKMKICSWSNLYGDLEGITNRLLANEKVAPPFLLLALNDNGLLNKKSAEIYAQAKYPFKSTLGLISTRPKNGKIQIGYFSADFRNHPVSFLTAELFELHDKNRFEITAFSFGADDKSPMRSRLSQAFHQFIDVREKSDKEIAQLTRELKIDIAVDLGGHTKDSRTGIFSYRAAPIQVNWLGYPGTSGTDFIDYIVADKTIIPAQSEQFYSEKVVSLPGAYLVDDSKRVASSRVFTREECGLPKNAFIFCCFNNDYKFNPLVLDGWSRILLAVKNSILWIPVNNEYFRNNITTEFEKRDIHSNRIIFAQRVELMADHLARYSLADLFLDTHPFNAHTTAVDSLKTGVPVLTLIGQSFASRVAASLLKAIGLPELITNSQEDYEALAIELAKNPQKLANIKLKLANNSSTTPLFNAPLFTKNLEAAYIKMHDRYLEGLSPECINV